MREDISVDVRTEKDKELIFKTVLLQIIGKDLLLESDVDFDKRCFTFQRINGPKFLWRHKDETISFREVAMMAKEFIYQRANIDLISSRNLCKYTYESGQFCIGSYSEEEAIINVAFDIIYKLTKQGRL